jgi:signal peptidase II
MIEQVSKVRSDFALWWADARANSYFGVGLIGAAVSIFLDQASKAFIVNIVDLPARGRIEVLPFFDLTYVRNFGASFGMGAGSAWARVVFSVIAIAIVGVLVGWLGRLRRRWAVAGAALIIGGAIGNLIDRVRQGFVTDFLDFSGLYFPWVFNVADVSINIGILCLIIDYVKHKDDPAASA